MSTMGEHSTEVIWHYVVPPRNDVRVVITQRQDGPFRGDAIAGRGHYYVSVEELVRGCWRHTDGSTQGGFSTFKAAYDVASAQWQKEQS